MALIVEGKMPTNCGFCIELRREGNGVCWCNRMQKQISEVVPPYDKRMEWCPIIGEIPDKHGRLKDADALIEKTRMWSLVRGDEYFELRVKNVIVEKLLEAVPTIVEATE